MKHAVLLVVLAGCPSDGNPKTLWLAPRNATETMVELIDHEPPPF
jgi:hypothetical protein